MGNGDGTRRYETAIATFVGLLALVISAYTAYEQHLQVRAQVWPLLEIASGNTPIAIWVTNKGAGPALVRDVRVRLDGRPVQRWRDVVVALAGDGKHNTLTSSLHGSVIGVGERVEWFQPRDENGAAVTGTGKVKWADAVYDGRARLDVEVCYCSTLDECWTLTSGPDSDETRPVRRCPKRSDDSFRD